jgi:CopG family transcriptional regulator, nickel-responsive regulator
VVGTITLVYNHHVRLRNEKLTDVQHDFHRSILSTLHVHLDHDYCLEVVVISVCEKSTRRLSPSVVRGAASEVQKGGRCADQHGRAKTAA